MFPVRWPGSVGILAFGGVSIALAVRLTQGLDLGDESYYAQFVVEWLRNGIAQSPFRTLHQTSALIVAPWAWALATFQGSTDGLFLVLRGLFLSGSLLAASFWYVFMRTLGYRGLAWSGAILILAFIPFGLPAPSYNTTGMQAAVIAIACVGAAMASRKGSTGRLPGEIGSAAAWGVATVAYPPLGVVAAIVAGAVLVGGERFFVVGRRYAGLVILAGCIAIAATVALLTPATTLESFHYLNLVNRVSGVGLKLESTMALLRPYPWFCCLAVAAACAGVFRNLLGPLFHPLIVAALLLALYAGQPALYIRSHDAITLAALAGLGILTDLRPSTPPRRRVVALCYLLAMLVAATTMASALHTVYNFCIGGLPAAAIALVASYSRPGPSRWPQRAAMAVLILIVLSTSLLFRYGQTGADAAAPKVLVRTGMFKGIFAPTTLTELLHIVQHDVRPKIGDATLAAFTVSHPGIALELDAPLRMLTTFPLPASISAEALAYTRAYYADLANRPQFVLLFREYSLEPINPMQPDFDAWYVLDTDFKTSLGVLSLYRKR